MSRATEDPDRGRSPIQRLPAGYRRRTSGEVINATLLEVFLALSFILFALASFYKKQADQVVGRELVPEGAVAIPRDSLEAWRKRVVSPEQVAIARDSFARLTATAALLETAQHKLDSLGGMSQYWPDCEKHAVPAEILEVTVLGGGALHVVANRPFGGLEAGATLNIATAAFPEHFVKTRAESERKQCEYLVRVHDTPAASKADLKAALGAISRALLRYRGATL